MSKDLKKILADACECIRYRRSEFLKRVALVQSFGDERTFQLKRLEPQLNVVFRVLAESEADLRYACDILMNAEENDRARANAEQAAEEK